MVVFCVFQLVEESKVLIENSNNVFQKLTHARRSALEWHVSFFVYFKYLILNQELMEPFSVFGDFYFDRIYSKLHLLFKNSRESILPSIFYIPLLFKAARFEVLYCTIL